VDTQADFMLPGGKLYVPGAEKTLPKLKRLVDAAREGRVLLVSDACLHTPNDPEFKTFPPHCIRGTAGAEVVPEGLAADVVIVPNDPRFELPEDILNHQQVLIEKQTLSVFDNPLTARIVDMLGPDVEYFVFGVVTEYCVRLAAKGLLERKRKVCVVKDAIETLNSDHGKHAIEELKSLGATLAITDEALAALQAAQ
jgi:nicotinamidase/pyrazinamidase